VLPRPVRVGPVPAVGQPFKAVRRIEEGSKPASSQRGEHVPVNVLARLAAVVLGNIGRLVTRVTYPDRSSNRFP
jgi:hypothetical protein